MGPVRIIILVVAAIAAILLMVIVGGLISHKPASAPAVAAAPAKPMTQVVVAAHDLAIGERLVQADLNWQDWPADAVNPSFITNGKTESAPGKDASAVVVTQGGRIADAAANAVVGGHSPMDGLLGAIVRTPILAHEPVTNAKLVRGGDGSYMAVVLSQGMRAIAVPINAGNAAAGFILPGDRVDVMQTTRNEGGDSGSQGGYVAQTLLQNIKVLAIDQSSVPPKNGGQAQLGQTATLEVRPAEAEILAIARARGEMTLTLRSYADVNASTNNAGGKTVQIIRNGQATETMVRP